MWEALTTMISPQQDTTFAMLDSLPLEVLLDVVLHCSPDALPALRGTSKSLDQLVGHHESFLCRNMAASYCHELTWAESAVEAQSLEDVLDGRALSPIQRLQRQWSRARLNDAVLRQIDLPALDAASKQMAMEGMPPPEKPEVLIRRGLNILWDFQSLPFGKRAAHVAAFSTEELDLLFGIAGIGADILLRAVCPAFFSDDFDEGQRVMLGLDPQYFAFMELVLTRGVKHLVEVAELKSEEAIQTSKSHWEAAACGPTTNENVHLLRRARRKAAMFEHEREDGDVETKDG